MASKSSMSVFTLINKFEEQGTKLTATQHYDINQGLDSRNYAMDRVTDNLIKANLDNLSKIELYDTEAEYELKTGKKKRTHRTKSDKHDVMYRRKFDEGLRKEEKNVRKMSVAQLKAQVAKQQQNNPWKGWE